jgi:hypothetical protein
MKEIPFIGALMDLQKNIIERYELACDVLGDLMACCSYEIGQETDHVLPDAAKVEALKTERRSYLKLKRSIAVNNSDTAERIITVYSPKARARMASVNTANKGIEAVR